MCDCLVALPEVSESAVALFAKNSDRPPGEAQHIEWLPPRRDSGPFRATYIKVDASRSETIGVLGSRPSWMWGLEHGVNEAGVAAGNEAIFTTLDPHGLPPRLTGMDLLRLGLERGDCARATVEVIVDLLERFGQGGSGHHGEDHPYWSSFLIADRADAWVLETSGNQWATEQVRRSRAISNRTTIPAFDAVHRDPHMPTEELTDPRLESSAALLAQGSVSVAALKAHLRDHGCSTSGFTVCMHVPGFMETTAAMVAELGWALPSGRPLAHICLGSPCRSIFVPVAVGQALGTPPPWERFAGLGAELRPCLDALEVELADEAPASADSASWAPEAWRRIEACLDSAHPGGV